MPDDVLGLMVGPAQRIQDKVALESFLALPGAADVIRSSSFEQVFFTVKTLGLADSLELLPLVTAEQICGFIDLDCWRKDTFVRKPLMEWVAAFVQVGPEETVRALSGIDESLIALFLKDLIVVYELERDEPPPDTDLVMSPDQQFGVGQVTTGEPATIAALILDGLFRFAPDLGYRLLRRVRYTTRSELEETAYQDKVRRLEVHGFVDYYEALSIYGSTPKPNAPVGPRFGVHTEPDAPEEDSPRFLPTVFADSIADGGFLLSALAGVPASATERLAPELTALGNRILSANLVSLGEVGGIRIALAEMRDVLTIGLESLSQGDLQSATQVLEQHHVQSVFQVGFDQLARLRVSAEALARFPNFSHELLESPDQEFYSGLIRFKPLLWDEGNYRFFQNMNDVRRAGERIEEIRIVSEGFLKILGPTDTTLRKAFNTAMVRLGVSGEFESRPLDARTLERFLSRGIGFPEPDLPAELRPQARIWLEVLCGELEPLVGKTIDPRFVDVVRVQL